MFYRLTIFFLVLCAVFLSPFYVLAGTVSSSYKYAWSNNVGYINFENVVVGDSALSGYAWSKNNGWIKFNPAQGGVLNSAGELSGYAWGENLGWVDFGNVSINSTTGKFSGTATGELIGTLTFDCSNYCDVRTDWRPAQTSPSRTSSGVRVNNSVPGVVLVAENSTYVETKNEDLIITEGQSGRYIKDVDNGQVIVEVPIGSVLSGATFYVVEEKFNNQNRSFILSDDNLFSSAFYNIVAKDSNGDFIHSFALPIIITLPVSVDLQQMHNLGVYWLNEVNKQWVLIPEAVFVKNQVIFQVSHLTKFAIFGNTAKKTMISSDAGFVNEKPKPALPIQIDENLSENIGDKMRSFWVFVVAIFVIGWFYKRRWKN